MAIIKCPECGNDISDKATTCPHCGVDVQAELRRINYKRNDEEKINTQSGNVNWVFANNQNNKKKPSVPIVLSLIVLAMGISIIYGVLERSNRRYTPPNTQEVITAKANEDATKVANTTNSDSEWLSIDSDSRFLSDEEINSLSKDEANLATYEIAARHGMIIHNSDLNDYFSKKSWYKPTISFEEYCISRESILNEYELVNTSRLAARAEGEVLPSVESLISKVKNSNDINEQNYSDQRIVDSNKVTTENATNTNYPSIGDSIDIGSIKFTLNNAYINNYLDKHKIAPQNASYLIVEYSYTNISKEPLYEYGDWRHIYVSIKSYDDTIYSSDENLLLHFDSDKYYEFDVDYLNPGKSVNKTVIFEIPNNILNTHGNLFSVEIRAEEEPLFFNIDSGLSSGSSSSAEGESLPSIGVVSSVTDNLNAPPIDSYVGDWGPESDRERWSISISLENDNEVLINYGAVYGAFSYSSMIAHGHIDENGYISYHDGVETMYEYNNGNSEPTITEKKNIQGYFELREAPYDPYSAPDNVSVVAPENEDFDNASKYLLWTIINWGE